MSLQIIKSVEGKDEYVLLPINIYHALREQIKERMKNKDYISFDPANYVDNPIALTRINAGITQAELAAAMDLTQAYVSKIENQANVTPKLLKKVKDALMRISRKSK